MIAEGQPFAILVRHFLSRLVRNGSELGAGGMVGLVAAPGAFSSIILLDKYSTLLDWIRGRVHQDLYTISSPDKYWFLTLSMGVTGIATVLNWDKILPDAQDYWNLAPLPLRPHAILLANTSAIMVAVLIFAVAVNGVSAILFPLFVSAAAQVRFPAFAQFVAVHAACTVLATLFTFCAVFAILGALSAILPRNLFHAVSAWVRGGMLVALVALLASGYAGPSAVVKALSESGTRFLPPFWYLGLYQSWQHRDTPTLAQAARLALPG